MAEKPLVPNKPVDEKFMTVFRPQADPMLDKDGNVMGPNEALEAQRKAFENAGKEDKDAVVEKKVKAEIKDLQVAGREQKKSLSELVKQREDDKKATEQLRSEVKKEEADDSKKNEEKTKQQVSVAEKLQQKVNEGAKAKQAEEGKKFNLVQGENK